MADDLRFKPIETEAADSVTPDPADEGAAKALFAKKRKIALAGLAGTVATAALAAGLHWAFVGSHFVSTENAYVGASTAQINAQVSGQILEVRVDDTEQVKQGDVLAVIDPADANLAVARAEAEYRRALQRVRQYFAQESAAEAQVQARQADAQRAAFEFERRRDLAATGAISAEEFTTTRAAYDAARANLTSAQQNLEAQRALTRGAGVSDHPETNAARAALETAQLALERTVIRAPIDGVVAQRRVQVGQRIETGHPLMIVAPLAEAYVDANFKEGQLGRVRIGQPVELTSDLYGEEVRFHGRVEGLGGGTGSAFAVIPAQNATGNWIKVVQRVPVRVTLDPVELAEHPLRVGLSMEARIDTRRSRS